MTIDDDMAEYRAASETVTTRHPDGRKRWCFRCRKRRDFELVITSQRTGYGDPFAAVQCTTCHTVDGDLFPGQTREWTP